MEGESKHENDVIMAVRLALSAKEARSMGVATCSRTRRQLHVCQFRDDLAFSALQKIMATHTPARLVLCATKQLQGTGDYKAVVSLCEQHQIPVDETHMREFANTDLDQDLAKLTGPTGVFLYRSSATGTDGDALGSSALAAVMRAGNLVSDDQGLGRYTVAVGGLAPFMALDRSAVEALNVFPRLGDPDKNMSLLGLLGKCSTTMGKRLLSSWLRQPLLDLDAVNERHSVVQALVDDHDLRSTLLHTCFSGIPDLDVLHGQVERGNAGLKEAVALFHAVSVISQVLDALKTHLNAADSESDGAVLLKRRFLEPFATLHQGFSKYGQMITMSVDMDALSRHEYLVNPNVTPELRKLKQGKDKLLSAMQELARATSYDLNVDEGKVKLNYQAQLGYHMRISRKNETALRKKDARAKFTALETRKDGVRFTSSGMTKLSQAYQRLNEEYTELQKELVKRVMGVVKTYLPACRRLSALIAELDVFAGFAHVAVNAPTPYVRPRMLAQGSGLIDLTRARHPCMEVVAGMDFIPNDVRLESKKSNCQVVTGPNMGGKSTYIRTVGVVCLMAQIGCFVPCDEASISLVDAIRARIGAGDSQLKGVSTFMKEMLEASSIIKYATKDSLVIIDELGRGTSTYDGFGLAWAICEEITANIGAFALFATHFHELTELAATEASVVNKHVTADTTDDSIVMLYEVRDGACDRSFGIHVAELADFPKEVVDEARQKALELESFGEQAEQIKLKVGAKRGRSEQDVDAPGASDKRVCVNVSGHSKRVVADESPSIGMEDSTSLKDRLTAA